MLHQYYYNEPVCKLDIIKKILRICLISKNVTLSHMLMVISSKTIKIYHTVLSYSFSHPQFFLLLDIEHPQGGKIPFRYFREHCHITPVPAPVLAPAPVSAPPPVSPPHPLVDGCHVFCTVKVKHEHKHVTSMEALNFTNLTKTLFVSFYQY